MSVNHDERWVFVAPLYQATVGVCTAGVAWTYAHWRLQYRLCLQKGQLGAEGVATYTAFQPLYMPV